MVDVLIALVPGLAIGLFSAVTQYRRVTSGENTVVIRNPDGSVYGGFAKVLFGVGVLWTVVGFVLALGLVKLVRLVL